MIRNGVILGGYRWNRVDLIPNLLSVFDNLILVLPIDTSVPEGMDKLKNLDFVFTEGYSASECAKIANEVKNCFSSSSWLVIPLDDYISQAAATISAYSNFSIYPERSAKIALDKYEMRKLWNEVCLKQGDKRLFSVKSQKIIFDDWSVDAFPDLTEVLGDFDAESRVIVKPVALSGSIEVHACSVDSVSETIKGAITRLTDSLDYAKGHNVELQPVFIVEEEIPRDRFLYTSNEYSIEVASVAGLHEVIGLTQKYLNEEGFIEVGHCHTAMDFPEELRSVMTEAIYHCLNKLSVNYAISHWEVIITNDNRVALVEAQLRPGGDRIVDLMTLTRKASPFKYLASEALPEALPSAGLRSVIWFLVPNKDITDIKSVDVVYANDCCIKGQIVLDSDSINKQGEWKAQVHGDNKLAHFIGMLESDKLIDNLTNGLKGVRLRVTHENMSKVDYELVHSI